MDLYKYWEVTAKQDADEIKVFFHENAWVNWHNTNEQFTLEEYIRANCEYPGRWNAQVERIERIDDLVISVVRVYSQEEKQSCHVTSFMRLKDNKIVSLDEYWGDDGIAPQWRLEKKIGRMITP